MLSLRSPPFSRLVAGLKKMNKKITSVESCCGGVISSSIMAEPGSSAVYYGGSVAYNTKQAKKLLLNDDELHQRLISPTPEIDSSVSGESEGDKYIRSKLRWTAETAVAFCEQMDVDYAIAEGGAAGPTFRPEGLNEGFAAIAVAGRDSSTGDVQLLAQTVIHSTNADREKNMRLFANAAADLAADTIGIPQPESSPNEEPPSDIWLDRATALRSDEDAINKLEQQSDTKYVVLRGTESLFVSPTELALLTEPPPNVTYKSFLGIVKGAPIFAVDVDDSFQPKDEDAYFANTRVNAPLLLPHMNELALYATAMSQWKKSHKFCSGCGSILTAVQGGTCLKCNACGHMSWPRQDPSIIVLVTNRDGTKALLGQSKRHPPKMFTCLAGFVEAGETFEKAVLREAYEETGVRVDLASVTYFHSQPWPFPRSAMIGFRASADDRQPLHVDPNELVDATWFDKLDVARAAEVPGAVMRHDVAEQALKNDPTLQVLIPPKGVIARALIDDWLEDQ